MVERDSGREMARFSGQTLQPDPNTGLLQLIQEDGKCLWVLPFPRWLQKLSTWSARLNEQCPPTDALCWDGDVYILEMYGTTVDLKRIEQDKAQLVGSWVAAGWVEDTFEILAASLLLHEERLYVVLSGEEGSREWARLLAWHRDYGLYQTGETVWWAEPNAFEWGISVWSLGVQGIMLEQIVSVSNSISVVLK